MESTVFPRCALNGQPRWKLVLLCSKGRAARAMEQNYIFLCIVLVSGDYPVNAEVKFVVSNTVKRKRKVFDSRGAQSGAWFETSLVCASLPGDHLVISCIVKSQSAANDQPKSHECNLSTSFGSLLSEELYTDVTLVVGMREFKAHKAVLATRSPVFKAMFASDMEESRNNRVEITDISPEVVQEMLTYIYTDSTPNLNERASGLLAAADKYELLTLKRTCEKSLSDSLTAEVATDTLILAETHGSAKLKDNCLGFIATHADEVVESKDWSKFVTEHPNLVTEVFRALAEFTPGTVLGCKRRRISATLSTQ